MASPAQMAANRRNAQRSTGPRTEEGKKAVRLNAVKHGMTAKVIVLAHELAVDYHEIRATLIEDYAPATAQELMLVDQVASGYWRTLRARRFETALFNEQIVAKKKRHRKDLSPNAGHDDSVAVAFLQEGEPKELDAYFRYDGTISRDYYRAINTVIAPRRRTSARDTPGGVDDHLAFYSVQRVLAFIENLLAALQSVDLAKLAFADSPLNGLPCGLRRLGGGDLFFALS